jgi:antitoxin component YwqK of YwqJK toxin-antitoxin module
MGIMNLVGKIKDKVLSYRARKVYANTGHEYHRRDRKRNEIWYDSNGHKIRYRCYYKSGALKWEIPYKNGKLNGIGKVYYKSGALGGEIPYENDKKNGMGKCYYESGALLDEILYKNGVLDKEFLGYIYCRIMLKGMESGSDIMNQELLDLIFEISY